MINMKSCSPSGYYSFSLITVVILALAFVTLSLTGCDNGTVPSNQPSDFRFTINADDTTYLVYAGTARSGAVVIPGSYNGKPVTMIGTHAFIDCTGLTSITIPASVVALGISPFSGCTNLASITVDENNPSFASEGGILYNKAKTSFEAVPLGISGAVTLPDSLMSIARAAFYECTRLTSVSIPASVTSIGELAFRNCSALTDITVDANNQYYTSEGGIAYNKAKTAIVAVPGGISGNITLPGSLTSIGNNAFTACANITGIEIPASVTEIGGVVFAGCSSLTSIEIPEGITSIGLALFEDCTSLTSVTLPASVTWIADMVFRNCSSLTDITLPTGLTRIDNQVFTGCASMTSITIPPSVERMGNTVFIDWTESQTIYVPFANQEEMDAAWGTRWRRYLPDLMPNREEFWVDHKATIVYQG
jgi:hypothetical protein